MTYPLYEKLDLSNKRKVFICGDIHGEYTKLTHALLRVGFQVETDILISVGDLVDRGPQSEEFETFIAQPWVRRVLGNHDLQPREYLLGYESEENVRNNGGGWFLEKSKEEQERIASLLEHGPIALEIITPGGRRVGVTHADMHARWDHLEEQCRDPGQERFLVNRLTASRAVIKKIQKNFHGDYTPNEAWVHGIDHVFHGHTPINEPLTFANRTWIDTGAFDPSGKLTILDIDKFFSQL